MKPLKMSLVLLISAPLTVCNAKTVTAPSEIQRGHTQETEAGRGPMSVVDGVPGTARPAVAAITIAASIADSVQAKLTGLAIAGGTVSNPRYIETKGQPERLVADYLLNGVKYTLSMERTGYVKLSTSTVSSEIKSFTDLPAGIQQFISARTKPNITSLLKVDETLKQPLLTRNELAYESCSVRQLPSGAKQYRVYVRYFGLTTLPLIFDEQANLIWAGSFSRLESLKNFDDLSGGLTRIASNDLAQFKGRFTAAAELKDFLTGDAIQSSQASLNVYGGVSGYEFSLAKQPSGESWYLAYDNNKALVDGYYSGWAK